MANPDQDGGDSGQHKKLSRFEQKSPEEQEIERQKIKEAIAQKLQEKSKIIAGIRKQMDRPAGQRPSQDDVVGHMEFDMGTRYEYVLRDYAKAREFYEKAVEHGYGLAMFNLGTWYLEGKNGVACDPLRARQLFEMAADKGVGMAKINLGFMFQNGLAGLEKDLTKAFVLYKDGVTDERNTAGDGHALLAYMYCTGNGGEQDTSLARTHLKEAIAKGARVHPGLEEMVFGKGESASKNEEHRIRRLRVYHALHTDMDGSSWPTSGQSWADLFRRYGYATDVQDWEETSQPMGLEDFLAVADGRLSLMESFAEQDKAVPEAKCERCAGQTASMAKCSRCGGHFCNKECQRLGWQAHKVTCKLGYMFI